MNNSCTIEYIKGDATAPKRTEDSFDIIAHCVNNLHGWGSGFVIAVSKRWPQPEQRYRSYRLKYKDRIPLGINQDVVVDTNLVVMNMVAQDGFASRERPKAVSYRSLLRCLRKLGDYALKVNATVHLPQIGSGLGGGSWDEIEVLIKGCLTDRGVPVIVYLFD